MFTLHVLIFPAAPTWWLHTGFCKFVQNISVNKYLKFGKMQRLVHKTGTRLVSALFISGLLKKHHKVFTLSSEWFLNYFLLCVTVQATCKNSALCTKKDIIVKIFTCKMVGKSMLSQTSNLVRLVPPSFSSA